MDVYRGYKITGTVVEYKGYQITKEVYKSRNIWHVSGKDILEKYGIDNLNKTTKKEAISLIDYIIDGGIIHTLR